MSNPFAEYLQELLDSKKMSDEDIVLILDISHSTLRRWLAGSTHPHLTVEKWARNVLRKELARRSG